MEMLTPFFPKLSHSGSRLIVVPSDIGSWFEIPIGTVVS